MDTEEVNLEMPRKKPQTEESIFLKKRKQLTRLQLPFFFLPKSEKELSLIWRCCLRNLIKSQGGGEVSSLAEAVKSFVVIFLLHQEGIHLPAHMPSAARDLAGSEIRLVFLRAKTLRAFLAPFSPTYSRRTTSTGSLSLLSVCLSPLQSARIWLR